MNILVTGGTGFIGTNLTNELISRGYNVTTCDYYNHHNSNHIRADVSKVRQLEFIFKEKKFDYVFHLAAEYGRWNGEDFYENLWLTNAIGTKNIIKMQERYGFKLIFFSSAEVYGDYVGKMSEDIMINNKIKDTYQMNDYAISKWAGELMCRNSNLMFDTETVIVRPVNCYGPHEHYTPYRGFIPKFIYLNLNNKGYDLYLGHKRIIDFVEDTVITVSNIIDNFKNGEAYNVGGKIEWENDIKYYSNLILKNLGLTDKNIKYHESESFTTKIKTIDFKKAINDLDHDPIIDPEEGIKRTCNWMQKFYNL